MMRITRLKLGQCFAQPPNNSACRKENFTATKTAGSVLTLSTNHCKLAAHSKLSGKVKPISFSTGSGPKHRDAPEVWNHRKAFVAIVTRALQAN
jgi:hypothetical protein